MRAFCFMILVVSQMVMTGQSLEKIDSINGLIDTFKSAQSPEKLIALHAEKGTLYFENKDFVNALPQYLIVDSLAKENQLINETTIMAIMQRAEISRRTFSYDGTENANALLEEALKHAKDINSETYIHKIYMKIADVKGLMGKYAEAKRYTDLAFPYYLKKDDSKSISWLYDVYANYYYAVDSLEKAGQVQFERLAYFRKKNDSLGLATTLKNLGSFYRKRMKNSKKAMPYLKESEAIYLKLGNTKQRNYLYLLEHLALSYADNGNHELAYNYYKNAYELRKVVVRESNNNLTRNLETKYQATAKQQEINLLASQNKLAEQQKINQRNVFTAGIGLTTLAGLFFFFQYRNRQKTTKKLQELDKAKSDFFANISHEFRTPLTLISGPIQKHLKREDLSENETQSFEMIDRNANRMLSLVDQLLDISKIETGHLKLHVSQGKPLSFIGTLLDGFTFSAKQKQIAFKTDIGNSNATWFDKDILEKVVVNIVSNAIKYTPEQGQIACKASVKNNSLFLEVKNTGKGLTKEHLEKVFDRFYQINNNREGVGIGLALVKELVELHKGHIKVDSIPNEWTTFSIELPMEKSTFKDIDIANDDVVIQQSKNVVSIASEIHAENEDDFNSDKDILLIVEDNSDVLAYVSDIFKEQYTILKASNGEEGIARAKEHIPDVIISDVMMPIKSGIELCDDLKANEITSHIPIILLTAKAGDENKLEGLKIGADDYLTKPFNEDILTLKVKKLIENRNALQERYSQEVVLIPKDINLSSADEMFLERVKTLFDEHLVEPDFNIESFGAAVGMSRMQLHRKIKALTGLTTSEFIRSQRLKLAAHLLKSSEINISQIGYSVGFNDHAYFSKCFKEQYGCTPTEYSDKA